MYRAADAFERACHWQSMGSERQTLTASRRGPPINKPRRHRMDDTAITVAATPQTVKWGFFDPRHPRSPAWLRQRGRHRHCFGEPPNLPDDGAFRILPEHRPILEAADADRDPHLLTGPIHVEAPSRATSRGSTFSM